MASSEGKHRLEVENLVHFQFWIDFVLGVNLGKDLWKTDLKI
jgi:hypothetical protein